MLYITSFFLPSSSPLDQDFSPCFFRDFPPNEPNNSNFAPASCISTIMFAPLGFLGFLAVVLIYSAPKCRRLHLHSTFFSQQHFIVFCISEVLSFGRFLHSLFLRFILDRPCRIFPSTAFQVDSKPSSNSSASCLILITILFQYFNTISHSLR